jgi:hypothetical protein
MKPDILAGRAQSENVVFSGILTYVNVEAVYNDFFHFMNIQS